MRGTRRCGRADRCSWRIIPAYAGNAPAGCYYAYFWADHPRVCGERQELGYQVSWSSGSSPRMRGTRQQGGRTSMVMRIIPAYAGNAVYKCTVGKSVSDHPRVCGERCWPLTVKEDQGGSSPRMRGTPTGVFAATMIRRIIPAYAGNAPRARRASAGSADHPRVCGERSRFTHRPMGYAGSSPRMRGTPPASDCWGCRGRIIPAYAGNATPDV